MTIATARTIARQFVRDFVDADRQWSLATLESYLPQGMTLRDTEDGDLHPPTIGHLTRVIARRAER